MPYEPIPYEFARRRPAEMMDRADRLLAEMARRRSCRFFSDEPVPPELIEKVIAIAAQAPSGANRQPWRFVAVNEPVIKRRIRLAAEEQERKNYDLRMPPEWLEALEPLGTDAHKPFLEMAPWLVVVFQITWEIHGGKRVKSYYPVESVGLAAGMFLMACHQVGLATLTHTPSPMGFLRGVLGRPANEKPFLLIPVGYPAKDCTVPNVSRKPLSELIVWNRDDETGHASAVNRLE